MSGIKARAPMRRHKFEAKNGALETCARCGVGLDAAHHRALPCGCGWRVAGDRCVCTRARDRYLKPECPWCRDGFHLTVTNDARPSPPISIA